jgi:hypothetical protein
LSTRHRREASYYSTRQLLPPHLLAPLPGQRLRRVHSSIQGAGKGFDYLLLSGRSSAHKYVAPTSYKSEQELQGRKPRPRRTLESVCTVVLRHSQNRRTRSETIGSFHCPRKSGGSNSKGADQEWENSKRRMGRCSGWTVTEQASESTPAPRQPRLESSQEPSAAPHLRISSSSRSPPGSFSSQKHLDESSQFSATI